MKKLLLIASIVLTGTGSAFAIDVNVPNINIGSGHNEIGITKLINGWEIQTPAGKTAYTGSTAIPDAKAAGHSAVDNIIK